MKRNTVVLGLLGVALSATAALADINVGVVLSSTGPAATLGIPEKNSLSFAPTTIGGQKVNFIVYDDATDTTTAVQNVKRFISENNVDLIIGPSVTPTSLAVVDVASEAKVPLISLASASPIVTPIEKRKWIFKVTANDEVTAEAMVAHMARRGIKTVGIIATEDPYGEANVKAFEIFAEKYGIKSTTIQKFKKQDTSATAQVLKIISSKPDAAYVVAAGTPSAMPHIALVDRGFKGPIYQSHGAASSEVIRVGGKALEGAYLPASPVLVAEQLPQGYPNKVEALKFAKAYEPKFGPRSTFAAHMWDALKLLQAAAPKALKGGKPGTAQFRESLRDAIENTKGLDGAYAVFNMSTTDHSGVDASGIAMLQVKDAKWKLDHISYEDKKKAAPAAKPKKVTKK